MSDALALLDSPGIVILHFHMEPTCPPCLRLAPILAKVAREEGVPVVKVNLHEKTFDRVADRFQVMETPTVVIVRDGQEVARGIPTTEIGLRRILGRAR
ncbi:MAG: hypothetical protein A3E01_07885 [Gammaproteobacteria bacterium RIFCSPHIGHO2_12_FULL_63_22]|nr:MAG: hypothetical protein A3E01_07885 [Gammaproteobacteria bacterium RIFCSPHIGHO2_12_FULL_63_22]